MILGSSALICGSLVSLDQAWYRQYERSAFHFFDDGDEWRGMDKLGHFFSAYTTAGWGQGMFRWAGAPPVVSRWVGGSLGWAFLAGVEVLDGFSEGWGFSGWDMLANTGGSLLFIGQDALWNEQRIRVKFSAHLTDFAPQRPDLLGNTPPERILKDYNGQTLWLSCSPDVLGRIGVCERLPWLNAAFGFGADGMISARETLADGSTDAQRLAQYYLSLDVDLRRIPTKSTFVRTVLDVLNCVKFPAPAVEWDSRGVCRGHWLYF